ncbi:MAG: hypothetical protein AUH72_14760 [Acidobacteria bacterium 13_1_40CM_4_65_8]|nr:MAG: hypothetical protein AUH72_14760 [Acidobacteria bacterium 13_1_40CM_4_65_8]
MKAPFTAAAVATLACLTLAACTVHQTETPLLTGPSGLALSARMEAIPDSIGLDGGSQSSVRVFANGPDGKPLAGVTFRVDMSVDNVVQDFGALSARSIVTGSDGIARVIYTAPAAPPNGLSGLCNGLPGTCVTIIASPTSTNFGTVTSQTVTIRLVPLGVILPPAETPTPAFTITPTPVNFNIPATFDGSTSCGGAVVGGRCTSASAITSYVWDFGDGGRQPRLHIVDPVDDRVQCDAHGHQRPRYFGVNDTASVGWRVAGAFGRLGQLAGSPGRRRNGDLQCLHSSAGGGSQDRFVQLELRRRHNREWCSDDPRVHASQDDARCVQGCAKCGR